MIHSPWIAVVSLAFLLGPHVPAAYSQDDKPAKKAEPAQPGIAEMLLKLLEAKQDSPDAKKDKPDAKKNDPAPQVPMGLPNLDLDSIKKAMDLADQLKKAMEMARKGQNLADQVRKAQQRFQPPAAKAPAAKTPSAKAQAADLETLKKQLDETRTQLDELRKQTDELRKLAGQGTDPKQPAAKPGDINQRLDRLTEEIQNIRREMQKKSNNK